MTFLPFRMAAAEGSLMADHNKRNAVSSSPLSRGRLSHVHICPGQHALTNHGATVIASAEHTTATGI